MKLDLDELLQDIHSWKNLIKQRDEEIDILKNNLSFAMKQNEALEINRASLLGEVKVLNSTVTSLRNSLKRIETFEEDRRNLQEEKQKLKNSLDSLEKEYYEKSKTLTEELQKIKEANKDETAKLVSQIKNEASKQLDIFKELLEKKENDIKELKTQMSKLLEERDQDILKMKIQYEDKIGKLKQQMPKSRIPTPHGLPMHDIFRQKYLKLEKDSGEQIAKLKEEIQTLKQLVESLKSKSATTSLTSALLAANTPNINTTAEVATQTESMFTELSRQFLRQAPNNDAVTEKKRNIFNELSRQFKSQVPNDDADFVSETKMNRTQSVVLPQKRKLFNLNENYYVKY